MSHVRLPRRIAVTIATNTNTITTAKSRLSVRYPAQLVLSRPSLSSTLNLLRFRAEPRPLRAAMSTSSNTAASAETTCPTTSETKPEAAAAELPPLPPNEFRQYNHMAEHMDLFHAHFRQTWNMLWGAATTGRRPAGMSLKSFVGEGLQFVRQLTMHHNIEETYVFPMLARKMPEFKAGKGNGAAELLRQHREIHKGMDALEEYLRDVQLGRQEFDLARLKERLESWGEILWTHLDQEVKTLGAENMRKYWTLAEMRNMRM